MFKIFILGCGGTGSNLTTLLAQLALYKNMSIVLIDNDIVEDKNRRNQKFTPKDVGKNKALVLAKRYLKLGIDISYIDAFIEKSEQLATIITEGTKCSDIPILVGCVDNNKARRVMHEVFDKIDNIVYIDTGNGTSSRDGQTVVGVKNKGKIIKPSIGYCCPQILLPEYDPPDEQSCTLRQEAEPQAFISNVMSSFVTFNILNNLIMFNKINSSNKNIFFFDADSIEIK